MENTTLIRVRAPEKLQKNASVILSQLGLNLNSYINMALSQLVAQGDIPFDVKRNHSPYTPQETRDEVVATLRMEGMDLTSEDIRLLRDYKSGVLSGNEIRQQIVSG